MNAFQFARLIHAIYGRSKKLPDLDWIQRQGLLAVKLSQMHALRIDFLDPEKCRHLAKLYRQNLPMHPQDLQGMLDEAAPEGFDEQFQSIDDQPIATASVGQVHHGVLSDGREVAIKVVKADVRTEFKADVQSLKRLFSWGTRIYPPLKRVGDPVALLDDVEHYTLSELDLEREVEGQSILRACQESCQSQYDLSDLYFPKIYPELSNRQIMVSEYLSGHTFDELLERGELEYEKVLALFRIHGFFMFCLGVFHGDLHPGNVILSKDRLCFIDTGFIGRLDLRLRMGLYAFFQALANYDYPACAKALNDMSEVRLVDAPYQDFERAFVDLYQVFTHATVSEVSLTKQMMRTIKLGVLHGMRFDKGIFSVIRSLMYMDGMVLRSCPDAVLMRDMKPFLQEADQWLDARDGQIQEWSNLP